MQVNAKKMVEQMTALKDKMQFEPAKSALSRWQRNIKAAETGADDEAVTIDMYDIIGEDWEGGGVTATLVSAILRKADGAPVVVNINSPGGSFFEGVTIYNLLREYSGDVRVRIVGQACSAASIIALAGDTVEIAETAFFMIHNSWCCCCGNKETMSKFGALLGQLDATMLDVYKGRSNLAEEDLKDMMAAETWLRATQAVEIGFADKIIAKTNIVEGEEEEGYNSALRQVENAMAAAGLTRSKRRELIKSLTDGKPGAANPPKPGAGKDKQEAALAASLKDLIQTLKK